MHILVTYDDGIYAPGIYALAQSLKKIAKVTVVAPDSERSSVGHAITLSHPIWVRKVNRKGRLFGYGVSGTPADCVKLGVKVILKKNPDLVVSGINLGCNDGCSIFYSGTVAGAREGALMGIPSIAFSLDSFTNPAFAQAAKFAIRLARLVSQKGLPKGTFLNVNVPNLPASRIKGVRITTQGKIPIHGTFSKRKDPHFREYYWLRGKSPVKKRELSVDTYALNQGYITVTPIHCDLTDHECLASLGNWRL